MVTNISFRSGETTGGVSDRKIETSKQETTGGVGARKNQESIFSSDNELKQDTVCFRGSENQKKKHSNALFAATILADTAIIGGLLGLAYKHNWVGKIGHEKTKDVLRHTDVVTKPCYQACKWIKNNSYDKIAAFFKK